MINLFNEIIQTTDGKFMCLSKESPLVTDNLLHNHVKKCLMEGMREKELVNLKGLRAGGTTSTLINFAKENDLSVIVLYGDIDKLRQEYNYKYIYNINSLNLARGGTKNNIVIDVGVYSKENIEKIKNAGFNIITGYIQDLDIKDEIHKNETNFNKDVINNLKKEIVLLGNSMKNERLKGNYSNYKHLINSYKEIMKLIQDLSKENNGFGEMFYKEGIKSAKRIVEDNRNKRLALEDILNIVNIYLEKGEKPIYKFQEEVVVKNGLIELSESPISESIYVEEEDGSISYIKVARNEKSIKTDLKDGKKVKCTYQYLKNVTSVTYEFKM